VSAVIDALDSYAAQFSELLSETKGMEPSWLTSVRTHAFDTFRRLGFPTTRDEEWRFTSVAPIIEIEYAPAADGRGRPARALVDAARLPAAVELVFVNGQHAPELSSNGRLADGIRVQSLAAAVAAQTAGSETADLEAHLARVAPPDRQAFVALNAASWTDGALVLLPPKTVVEAPIHLIFASVASDQPSVAHPRVLVIAGADSQASIVETYVGAGEGRYFTNAVTEAVLGEQTRIEHYKVQRESEASGHIATTYATVGKNATFNSHSISFGGALVRNDVVVSLDGEGGLSTLNGLYLVDAARLVDNHTTIDHARPHCDSREVYKGILAGRARAVFNGKIIVRPDAQKTDAKQTNKALLLSEDAQINTKPQLEIFANDVKCTHGAAVGQMDDDALFYLRARGLPIEEARRMLIHAFAGDVLNKMPLDSVRDRAEAELLERLATPGAPR
jgi:Fe-S cluster assembly protein SufD